MPRLFLASMSARRLELLRSLGIEPVVYPTHLDESLARGEGPRDAALRLAREKALHAAGRLEEEGEGRKGLVVGADTVVEIDGEALGKPEGDDEARAMLARLSGRVHRVHTGVAVLDLGGRRLRAGAATTEVRFAPLAPDEIAWYAATGEGSDKAGGYAVQGRAALFIAEIRGSYSNVVGLPMDLLYRLCLELGHDLKRLGTLS